MDVLGKPQDTAVMSKRRSTFPFTRAHGFDETGGQDLLVHGHKLSDLLVPFAKGGKVACSVGPAWARPSTCSS